MNTKNISASLLAVAMCATASQADLVGVLDITTGTGFTQSISIDGTQVAPDAVLWSTQLITDEFSVAVTMVGNPDAPTLGTVVQATNSSGDAMQMTVDFTIPIAPMSGGEAFWAGSLAASLDGTDVLLESILDTAIWTASIGNDSVGTLFDAPFQLAVVGTGSNNAMDSGSGSFMWSGGDTLAVHFSFALDSGASVMFNGGFGVIPGPGTLALLGLCPFMRRRRRTC